MRQLCLLAEDVNANQAKELKLLGWVHCYVPLAMLLIPKFEGSMILIVFATIDCKTC